MSTVKFSQSNSVYSKKIDGKWVVLKKNGGHYYSFNDTAGLLWESLKKPMSNQNMSDLLVKQFGIDLKTAKEDVEEFIEDGIKDGLITQKV